MSDKGKDTNDFFFERIPKSIRKKIESQVALIKFADQADPNAVKTEILPVAPYQYMASLQMLDAGTPILEMKVFAGSKAEAEKEIALLNKDAEKIQKEYEAAVANVNKNKE